MEDGRKFKGEDFIGPLRKGRKVIIGGDNDKPELLADDLKEADVLVHESTHTEEVRENLSWSSKHSTAKMVATAAQNAELKNLILTHFSPRFSLRDIEGLTSIGVLQKEAQENYQGNLFMARDFDIFHLDRKSELSIEYRRQRRSPKPLTNKS